MYPSDMLYHLGTARWHSHFQPFLVMICSLHVFCLTWAQQEDNNLTNTPFLSRSHTLSHSNRLHTCTRKSFPCLCGSLWIEVGAV